MAKKSCYVCEKPARGICCNRCTKLVNRKNGKRKIKRNNDERRAALKRAWDKTAKAFRCVYTNVKLLLAQRHKRSPRYLTFDHSTPRSEKKMNVVASAINDMKSDMADSEFKRVVGGLAKSKRFNNTGGAFDAKLLKLKHWKR